MREGIDLNAVEAYNKQLKTCKETVAKLQAELEYTEKSLNDICAELTTSLGVQVTPQNIEEVYAEQAQKIQQSLKTGTAVLQKITEGERVAANDIKSEAAPTPVPQQAPMQNPGTAGNQGNAAGGFSWDVNPGQANPSAFGSIFNM